MSRNGALDILKIILALMVVGLHAGFLTDVSNLAGYLAINGLFRIAVPIFLLINGFFFYRVASTGDQCNWFKRVAYLYLFWMAVYLPYWLPDYRHGAVPFAKKLLHTIFFGCYHLWYLSGMIGAAVVLNIAIKAGAKVALTLAGLAFLGGIGIQYAGSYHLLGNSHFTEIFSLNWIHRNFLFFSFPFFYAGYVINKYKLLNRLQTSSAAILVVLGLVLLLIESGLNYRFSFGESAFDNLVSLAILCPAIFSLFMKMEIKVDSKELSQYSTGIYLVHILVILWIQRFFVIEATALTAVVIAVSAMLSFVLVKVSKKAPFIL